MNFFNSFKLAFNSCIGIVKSTNQFFDALNAQIKEEEEAFKAGKLSMETRQKEIMALLARAKADH